MSIPLQPFIALGYSNPVVLSTVWLFFNGFIIINLTKPVFPSMVIIKLLKKTCSLKEIFIYGIQI